MLLYSAESVLKKVILSQFAVDLSSIFNNLNQCIHSFLPADNNGTLSHWEFNAVAKGHFYWYYYFYKTADWKVCFHMKGNLKLFISSIYKNHLCYEKTKYDMSFSFMSNRLITGMVTLLGCCDLMHSSLCAVSGSPPFLFLLDFTVQILLFFSSCLSLSMSPLLTLQFFDP